MATDGVIMIAHATESSASYPAGERQEHASDNADHTLVSYIDDNCAIPGPCGFTGDSML
jgi:hypothetical protein